MLSLLKSLLLRIFQYMKLINTKIQNKMTGLYKSLIEIILFIVKYK